MCDQGMCGGKRRKTVFDWKGFTCLLRVNFETIALLTIITERKYLDYHMTSAATNTKHKILFTEHNNKIGIKHTKKNKTIFNISFHFI